MKSVNDKYKKTIEILKKSKPVTGSTDIIAREVLRRISSSSGRKPETFPVFDFLFSWTEIVWIRRSLIAASILLVAMFIHQQSVIVKQLNWLSNQIIFSQEKTDYKTRTEFVRRLKLLRFSENTIPQERNNISGEQLENLIESLDKLQSDYDDLMKIIQDDPELKELIEKKLNEMNNKKIKL